MYLKIKLSVKILRLFDTDKALASRFKTPEGAGKVAEGGGKATTERRRQGDRRGRRQGNH